MKWVSVDDYLPGTKVRPIALRDSAGAVYLWNSSKRFIGPWLREDGRTETRITHWMDFEEPGDKREGKKEAGDESI